MIKILLPIQHDELSYEGVWVKELSPNTGEIDNLPVFTRQYKFRDVIEFDPETCKATGFVHDGGYAPTRLIRYRGRFEDEKAKWEARGYAIEGMVPGAMAVARKRMDSR